MNLTADELMSGRWSRTDACTRSISTHCWSLCRIWRNEHHIVVAVPVFSERQGYSRSHFRDYPGSKNRAAGSHADHAAGVRADHRPIDDRTR